MSCYLICSAYLLANKNTKRINDLLKPPGGSALGAPPDCGGANFSTFVECARFASSQGDSLYLANPAAFLSKSARQNWLPDGDSDQVIRPMIL